MVASAISTKEREMEMIDRYKSEGKVNSNGGMGSEQREVMTYFHEMYYDRLVNAVVHVTKDRVAAEDVAQEAFINAIKGLGGFKQGSAFYTWLYRIGFNIAISRRRKPVAQKEMLADADILRAATGEADTKAEDPLEACSDSEGIEHIGWAIQQLSEEHRTILVLRSIEECSYEEIAQIVDISVGTVRSRLHRARAELRGILREHLADTNWGHSGAGAKSKDRARSKGIGRSKSALSVWTGSSVDADSVGYKKNGEKRLKRKGQSRNGKRYRIDQGERQVPVAAGMAAYFTHKRPKRSKTKQAA